MGSFLPPQFKFMYMSHGLDSKGGRGGSCSARHALIFSSAAAVTVLVLAIKGEDGLPADARGAAKRTRKRTWTEKSPNNAGVGVGDGGMAADAEAAVTGAGGFGMAVTERLVAAGAAGCGMVLGAEVAAAGAGGGGMVATEGLVTAGAAGCGMVSGAEVAAAGAGGGGMVATEGLVTASACNCGMAAGAKVAAAGAGGGGMAAYAEAAVTGAGGFGMATQRRLWRVLAAAGWRRLKGLLLQAAAGSGGFKLPDNRVSVIVALNKHAVKDLEAILHRHAHPHGLT
eukprot:jgi/Tetstr1/427759/TSEL_017877.t2